MVPQSNSATRRADREPTRDFESDRTGILSVSVSGRLTGYPARHIIIAFWQRVGRLWAAFTSIYRDPEPLRTISSGQAERQEDNQEAGG